jgi:hypothetical protein
LLRFARNDDRLAIFVMAGLAPAIHVFEPAMSWSVIGLN